MSYTITILLWVAAVGSGLMAGVYFIGIFLCTVVFNVPLNNMLAESDNIGVRAEKNWSHYLVSWTRWNHLRTVSSLLCCGLCSWLLILV